MLVAVVAAVGVAGVFWAWGVFCLGSLWRLMLWFLRNVARNSQTCISNIEIASLEFYGFLDTYEKLGYPNYVRVLVDEVPKANSCVRSSSHDTAHDPRDSSPLGSVPDQVQETGGTTAIVDGRHIQDAGDVFVAVGGVTPHVRTPLTPVAAHAHMQDRGTPPAGLMRQAPDHRVTRLALAPAAPAPPILTSNTARQHFHGLATCADPSPPTPSHPGERTRTDQGDQR